MKTLHPLKRDIESARFSIVIGFGTRKKRCPPGIFKNLIHEKRDDHLPPSPSRDLGSIYKVLQHDSSNYKHCSIHSTEYVGLKTSPSSYVRSREILTRSCICKTKIKKHQSTLCCLYLHTQPTSLKATMRSNVGLGVKYKTSMACLLIQAVEKSLHCHHHFPKILW
jgi:hypothetical protein